MKKLLQAISDINSKLIVELKAKKEAYSLGKIAGGNLDGNISFSEYQSIMTNIDGHSKEWRRFKENPNIIVIERNLFFNTLPFIENIFMFRPKNDKGETFIKLPTNFYNNMPTKNTLWLIILGIIVGCTVLASLYISFYFLFCFLLTIPVLQKQKETNCKYKVQYSAWEKLIGKNPSQLFYSPPFYSFRKDKGMKTVLHVQSGSCCRYDKQYKAMLKQLTVNAHQFKGKIVWLWKYDHESNTRYDFLESKITQESDGGEILNLNLIPLSGSSLVPAIETDYSIIFFLDYFSEEMEKDYNYDSFTDKIAYIQRRGKEFGEYDFLPKK